MCVVNEIKMSEYEYELVNLQYNRPDISLLGLTTHVLKNP